MESLLSLLAFLFQKWTPFTALCDRLFFTQQAGLSLASALLLTALVCTILQLAALVVLERIFNCARLIDFAVRVPPLAMDFSVQAIVAEALSARL